MLKLFIADIKMMLRNRQALFWTLLFPLMFTFIFGMFFGKNNTNGGTITIINHSNTELAKTIETSFHDANLFKFLDESNEDAAREHVRKNDVAALIIIPEHFGEMTPSAPRQVKLVYDPANSSGATVVTSMLDNVLNQVNYKAQNVTPLYSVDSEKTNTRTLTYFDFILVGLIGMALMNSSIQGVGVALSKYREDKILKRLTTTPVPMWQVVLGEILSRLILNFVQVTLILVVGVYLFDAHIYGNLGLIYLFSLIGALLFLSIGFAVAAMSKTTQAAEGMSTAVSIPMMFLAGVFFPIDQLPKWLYSIVQYLPLAPLLKMIRGIALDQASPLSNPVNLLLVIGWIVVMLTLTLWRFRMSEE